MESILTALYHGQIYPSEQYAPKTKEFQALQEEQLTRYNDFIQQLPPALSKQFRVIIDDVSSSIPYEYQSMFTNGFRLGALLMLEVLQPPL